MRTIFFTGGGTSGHVTPNFPLIKKFQTLGWNVVYIGSQSGIEKDLITRLNIPYQSISTGKLRRYFSWQNFAMPWHVVKGIIQAYSLCRQLKPNVIFSKGGFVALPVVLAAWTSRIPVIAHESDLTPGLANRLSFPFVKNICVTFSDSSEHFKNNKKVLYTGTPLREELLMGNSERGKAFCNFHSNKPIILIMGGSLGSEALNKAVRKILPKLLETFQVINLCGQGKTDPTLENQEGYRQFEYLNEEMGDVLSCADLVISRAGANSIYELLALRKPHLLIPLPATSSRGDQIENARHSEKQGLSLVLEEDQLSDESLLKTISSLYKDRAQFQQKLNQQHLPNSVELICDKLVEVAK